MATIPADDHWIPRVDEKCKYIKGQCEVGEGGFRHWQVLLVFSTQVRLPQCKLYAGERAHVEPTRSPAAEDYVWKEQSRVEGSQFELGVQPFRRNDPVDWGRIREAAKDGRVDDIPDQVFVQNYQSIKRIEKDYMSAEGMERKIWFFYGVSGAGKSRRAWQEAGDDAYPKDPNSKFWDGYRGQENVVIDEFRG